MIVKLKISYLIHHLFCVFRISSLHIRYLYYLGPKCLLQKCRGLLLTYSGHIWQAPSWGIQLLYAGSTGARAREHNSLHCPFLPVLVFTAADHEHHKCVQALVADGSSHLCPTSLPCPVIPNWVVSFLPILLIVKNKTSKPEVISGCWVFGQELC